MKWRRSLRICPILSFSYCSSDFLEIEMEKPLEMYCDFAINGNDEGNTTLLFSYEFEEYGVYTYSIVDRDQPVSLFLSLSSSSSNLSMSSRATTTIFLLTSSWDLSSAFFFWLFLYFYICFMINVLDWKCHSLHQGAGLQQEYSLMCLHDRFREQEASQEGGEGRSCYPYSRACWATCWATCWTPRWRIWSFSACDPRNNACRTHRTQGRGTSSFHRQRNLFRQTSKVQSQGSA